MDSLKTITSLLVCISLCLRLAAGIATSHQSIVSGEGWGYKYGIVHGPHGIGHAVGESYPHGYGGFGTYAPSYGYEDYDSGHHHLPIAAVHGPPEVHLPLPEVHGYEHLHAEPELIHLPVKVEAVKVLEPIKAIHPLPHAFPSFKEVKSIAAPEYVLPGYLAGHHYGGDYGSGYDIGYGSDYTSGSGYGHHYSTGYGSGYGTGYGSGYGTGYGSGYGTGYGSGYGTGYGSGYGTGYSSGYGTGNGGWYGTGNGGWYGTGYGGWYGNGYGQHYSSGYPSEYNYGKHLSHNYHDQKSHYFKGFPSYDQVLVPSHGLYGDYSGEQYKTTYTKPHYNDYYGSSSYHR